jgi:hypothetical protein
MVAAVQATPLAIQLVVYFAVNPDEELTVADVCEKWAALTPSARYTIKQLASVGVLSLRRQSGTRGGHAHWIASAGPELLRMRAGR